MTYSKNPPTLTLLGKEFLKNYDACLSPKYFGAGDKKMRLQKIDNQAQNFNLLGQRYVNGFSPACELWSMKQRLEDYHTHAHSVKVVRGQVIHCPIYLQSPCNSQVENFEDGNMTRFYKMKCIRESVIFLSDIPCCTGMAKM